jgi:tetratricopeptide (TPR) repeat protein
MTNPQRDGAPWFRRGGTILLALLLGGLLLRILYIVQLHGSDLWGLLSLDARFYSDLAHRVSSRLSLPEGVVTYNPLYPVFLGLLFRMFGESLLAARIIQSVLGLVTVWLLYESGCRLSIRGSGRNVLAGLIAALMAMLYAQFVLFEGSLLATSLVTLLLTASVALLLVIDESIGRGGSLSRPGVLPFVAFGVGAMLGAGVMGRPNLFLVLVPAVPLWFGFKHGKWLPAAVCLLGSVMLLMPITIHNGAATGRFIPLPAHGGINLYVGNGPDADGTFSPPPGMRASMEGYIDDARLRAEALAGKAMTDGEASRYWTRAAIDAIRADWGGWFALLGRKTALFWNGAEISDVIDLSFYREISWALRLQFLPFSLISALALVGFLVLWKKADRRGIILLFAGAGLLSILPFYVNTRYRMPVVPLLILSAAFFVSWAVDLLRERRWRSVALAGALLVILFSMTARPMVAVNRSAGYTFLGNYHLEQGREGKALAAFEEAYRLDPDRVETVVNYARILRVGGDRGRALQLYGRAYGRWPDFPMLAVEYGSLLEESGEREAADEILRYAVSLGRRRDTVIACKLLSRIAFEGGRGEEAEHWIRRALELSPGDQDLIDLLDWLRENTPE